MCGIGAIWWRSQSTTKTFDIREFADDFLYTDALRGQNATGAFVVPKDGGWKYYKDAIEARIFTQLPGYKSLVTTLKHDNRALVMHNRKATSQASGYTAAHPFAGDRTILVHNGTLRQHYWYPKTDPDMDSARLHAAIDACTTEDEVLAVLSEINGAYALVWYDRHAHRLYFCRNTERPLHVLHNSQIAILASELNMGYFCAARRGLVGINDNDKTQTEVVHPHTLYRYDFGEERMLDLLEYKEKPRGGSFISTSTNIGSATRAANKASQKKGQPAAPTVVSSESVARYDEAVKQYPDVFRALPKLGSLLVVQYRAFSPYSNGTAASKMGILIGQPVDLFGVTMPDGVELRADVHQTPSDYIRDGLVDEVTGRFRSVFIGNNQDGQQHIWLVLSYENIHAYREGGKHDSLYLRDVFGDIRYFYGDPSDDPAEETCIIYPLQTSKKGKVIRGDALTSRECDMLSIGTQCEVCGESAERVPYTGIQFTGFEDEWMCTKHNSQISKRLKELHSVWKNRLKD